MMDGSQPQDGFSAAALTIALRQWPRVEDLTLLGVSSGLTLKGSR
jgi:hypothetical protein